MSLEENLKIPNLLHLNAFQDLNSAVKRNLKTSEIVSEYDQEIPQLQTADNPVALPGRAAKPPRDTRKTN